MKTFAELTHTDTHKATQSKFDEGDCGFEDETPSAIQAQALPILLGEPTDFIGLAATGTGKTAAFGIPMLERIDTSSKTLQAMILCPTRELALQV
ncbi:MAG: DEAD/DEAH box helicase [Deltaproteobacteria bacterium]|nr:MAG: DEAD/DEAH box helicase [Deltaproteobacteria bacterium]